jgi:hypothetical protein
MYKILFPAPGTFFTAFAGSFFCPVKHILNLLIGKCGFLFLQMKKCPGKLFDRICVFFNLCHIGAGVQCLSIFHGDVLLVLMYVILEHAKSPRNFPELLFRIVTILPA